MKARTFRILEIVGVPIIYLVATFLHFVYDLTNGSPLSILFGSVNESVWEHVKIFSVGYVAWAIIEFLSTKPPFHKFVVAKTAGLYFLSISIIVFFYTYTFFTKKPILVVDLIASFIFTILSQYLSYRLTTSDTKIESYFSVSAMLLLLYFIMFFSFTLFPPKIDLFKDPVTGLFGIIRDNIDLGAVFLDKTA